jgi:uncharacterized membrane protein YeiH
VFGALTALGGGTLRDIILDIKPPFWIHVRGDNSSRSSEILIKKPSLMKDRGWKKVISSYD